MTKKIELITDGACTGNPGPGGWAALIRFGAKEKLLAGGEADTTNNRMELMAVIEGLKALKEACEVTITSDSQYVINAFEKGWLQNWLRNGWKTANRAPVKNDDLWRELMELVKIHTVKWVWVRGHSGHEDNERVDAAARAEAARIGNNP